MRIGICDWGIGGLGFYSLLCKDRPDVDVIYLGDQGFTPYGRASTRELTDRMRWVFTGFRDKGVSQVVVACNAASTVLADSKVSGVETTGVIEPTLRTLARSKLSVGVIGGRRTIRSGAYRRPLASMGIAVSQRVAQPLSGLIEAGKAHDVSTHELLRSILHPIGKSERLVLACTHYVVLQDVAHSFMPNAEIVDPATEVWDQLKGSLPESTNRTGTTCFYTTGDPGAMEAQALNAFGVAAKVDLWS